MAVLSFQKTAYRGSHVFLSHFFGVWGVTLAVSILELTKAIDSLSQALSLHKSAISQPDLQKALRDASIQRFEYCIELCWKAAMKTLGSTTAAAKPAVREMARNDLIDNPSLWLEFIDARNNTSHSYDENVAGKVFATIQVFFPEAERLCAALTKMQK